MPKFSEKTFLNFTSDDYAQEEINEDFRDSIRQDYCWIGDRFFFYQKGMFDKRVVSMEHVIWFFPYREAPKGRAGHKLYNDSGKLCLYSDQGVRMDFSFDTPAQAETIYGMLASTFAEEYHIITGMSKELQQGIDEGGVDGFRQAMAKLQEKFRQQAAQNALDQS